VERMKTLYSGCSTICTPKVPRELVASPIPFAVLKLARDAFSHFPDRSALSETFDATPHVGSLVAAAVLVTRRRERATSFSLRPATRVLARDLVGHGGVVIAVVFLLCP